MGIPINSNFDAQSATYLDARGSVEDLVALKGMNEDIIPDGFETYVKSEDCKYKFLKSNEDDPITGKWRSLELNTNEIEFMTVQEFQIMFGNVTVEPYTQTTSTNTSTEGGELNG